MAATISDDYKRDILRDIYNSHQNINVSAGDSDRFYIGIGRPEEWDNATDSPPTPNPSFSDIKYFQSSLQSIKLVTDASYVIPRYNWSAGSQYSAWDDKFSSNTTVGPTGDITGPYYVMTDDNNVYVCIQQGKTAQGSPRNSSFKPVDTTGNNFSAGDDGYIWRYMFTVGATGVRKYLSSAYIPVEKIIDSSQGGPAAADLSVSRASQLALQKTSDSGSIIGIAVDSGGTGYGTGVVPVTITGANDSEASAFARAYDGSIYEVIMKIDSANPNFHHGKGYDHAAVIAGGAGAGAVLRAMIARDSGMHGDPRVNLNSSAIMFSTQLSGSTDSDFITSNDFRQIGLIKNPQKDSCSLTTFPSKGEDSAVDAQTAFGMKRLFTENGTLVAANITGDQTVTGGTSGAKAIVDKYENDSTGILFIHQTQTTGFTPFDSGESITVSQSGGTDTIRGFAGKPIEIPAEFDRFSGEVIYIDNRDPIERDNDQTEDIKIVIEI